MPFDLKLERFKTDINLVEYAGSCGYALLKQESSRNSAVMKSADGEKIIIARNTNGHWMYFSVHDDRDNGTIVDFVLQRKAANNLGRVKLELSDWVEGRGEVDTGQEALRLPLVPISRDRQGVLKRFSSMSPVSYHPYLTARGLTESLLSLPPFHRKVVIDDRRNAVFPHEDEEGLCGYEMKNKGFTGFASGGVKGLWSSHPQSGDTDLVIAESAIDALSYAALFQRPAVYVSTAGAWNPKTPTLLQAKTSLLPKDGKIILAFDHDPQGKVYELQARQHLQGMGLEIISHFPEQPGTDWNDVLRLRMGTLQKEVPSNRPEFDLQRGE